MQADIPSLLSVACDDVSESSLTEAISPCAWTGVGDWWAEGRATPTAGINGSPPDPTADDLAPPVSEGDSI